MTGLITVEIILCNWYSVFIRRCPYHRLVARKDSVSRQSFFILWGFDDLPLKLITLLYHNKKLLLKNLCREIIGLGMRQILGMPFDEKSFDTGFRPWSIPVRRPARRAPRRMAKLSGKPFGVAPRTMTKVNSFITYISLPFRKESFRG